jgi:hypothetical protein
METSQKVEEHRSRMLKMRQSLKAAPIIRTATLPLESKLEKAKLRRKSATLDTPLLDKGLADS